MLISTVLPRHHHRLTGATTLNSLLNDDFGFCTRLVGETCSHGGVFSSDPRFGLRLVALVCVRFVSSSAVPPVDCCEAPRAHHASLEFGCRWGRHLDGPEAKMDVGVFARRKVDITRGSGTDELRNLPLLPSPLPGVSRASVFPGSQCLDVLH